MTVTDYVLSSNEIFFEEPGKLQLHRGSIEKVSRFCRSTKLATTGCFAKEPVRRMIVAMSRNKENLGFNRTNCFHYQKVWVD